MKKAVFVGLVILIGLSACVPDFLNSSSQVAPVEAVDIAATVDAVASTRVAETFEAIALLATPTMVEPTVKEVTSTKSSTESKLPFETPTLEATETPDGTELVGASLTPEGTLSAGTLTATSDGTVLPTVTGTLEATGTSIYPSPTSPISINQPPAYIPRYKIKIINNTKVKVYISLQGVTVGDYHPITEYGFNPWEKTRFAIPEGKYTAVVYVGSDPMVAYFGIHGNNEVTIIIDKNKLTIEK